MRPWKGAKGLCLPVFFGQLRVSARKGAAVGQVKVN